MTKLIIGCGYLGSRVAALWRQQGHEVYATTRNEPHAGDFRSRGWEPVVCDVLRPESLRSLPKVSTVLYCVGLDRTAPATMRDVYVGGLGNVLDHLPKPKRFIHVSSTSVYGQTDGQIVDETSPTEPAGESGRIVLDAEELLRAKLPEAIILRLAGIYGPDRGLRKKEVSEGKPIQINPDRWLNLIHVDDGARAVLAAEQNGRPGEVYNVSDGCPVRKGDFYRHMAKLMGAPEPAFAPLTGPVSDRERVDRRICNRKMLEQLKVELRISSFAEGLAS